MQIPISLAWAITIHKSQGLTLKKAVDFGEKEYAAGLSFVAISRVCSLENVLFRSFSFERLGHVKKCKRLQEKMDEERRKSSMILQIMHSNLFIYLCFSFYLNYE
jgi:hypothetical protein